MAKDTTTGADEDLNKALSDVVARGNEIKTRLGELLGIYEDIFRQSNRILADERDNIPQGDVRAASELDDFHRLVQTVRRNRDVVGSMLRGVAGLRPLAEFKFVETPDAPKEQTEKEKKAKAAKKKAKSAESLPMRQPSRAEAQETGQQPEAEVKEVGQVTEINQDSLFDDEGNGGSNA